MENIIDYSGYVIAAYAVSAVVLGLFMIITVAKYLSKNEK